MTVGLEGEFGCVWKEYQISDPLKINEITGERDRWGDEYSGILQGKYDHYTFIDQRVSKI